MIRTIIISLLLTLPSITAASRPSSNATSPQSQRSTQNYLFQKSSESTLDTVQLLRGSTQPKLSGSLYGFPQQVLDLQNDILKNPNPSSLFWCYSTQNEFISIEMVNDGHCDCSDGTDEPATGVCADLNKQWRYDANPILASLSLPNELSSRFDDGGYTGDEDENDYYLEQEIGEAKNDKNGKDIFAKNDKMENDKVQKNGTVERGDKIQPFLSQLTFTCQSSHFAPKTILSSLTNDGVCDCCDGSDEWLRPGLCKDTCGEEAVRLLNDLERFTKIYTEMKTTNFFSQMYQIYELQNNARVEQLTDLLNLLRRLPDDDADEGKGDSNVDEEDIRKLRHEPNFVLFNSQHHLTQTIENHISSQNIAQLDGVFGVLTPISRYSNLEQDGMSTNRNYLKNLNNMQHSGSNIITKPNAPGPDFGYIPPQIQEEYQTEVLVDCPVFIFGEFVYEVCIGKHAEQFSINNPQQVGVGLGEFHGLYTPMDDLDDVDGIGDDKKKMEKVVQVLKEKQAQKKKQRDQKGKENGPKMNPNGSQMNAKKKISDLLRSGGATKDLAESGKRSNKPKGTVDGKRVNVGFPVIPQMVQNEQNDPIDDRQRAQNSQNVPKIDPQIDENLQNDQNTPNGAQIDENDRNDDEHDSGNRFEVQGGYDEENDEYNDENAQDYENDDENDPSDATPDPKPLSSSPNPLSDLTIFDFMSLDDFRNPSRARSRNYLTPELSVLNFVFNNGERCWNGQSRSLTMKTQCGTIPTNLEHITNLPRPRAQGGSAQNGQNGQNDGQNDPNSESNDQNEQKSLNLFHIVGISEPSMCKYEALAISPLMCSLEDFREKFEFVDTFYRPRKVVDRDDVKSAQNNAQNDQNDQNVQNVQNVQNAPNVPNGQIIQNNERNTRKSTIESPFGSTMTPEMKEMYDMINVRLDKVKERFHLAENLAHKSLKRPFSDSPSNLAVLSLIETHRPGSETSNTAPGAAYGSNEPQLTYYSLLQRNQRSPWLFGHPLSYLVFDQKWANVVLDIDEVVERKFGGAGRAPLRTWDAFCEKFPQIVFFRKLRALGIDVTKQDIDPIAFYTQTLGQWKRVVDGDGGYRKNGKENNDRNQNNNDEQKNNNQNNNDEPRNNNQNNDDINLVQHHNNHSTFQTASIPVDKKPMHDEL